MELNLGLFFVSSGNASSSKSNISFFTQNSSIGIECCSNVASNIAKLKETLISQFSVDPPDFDEFSSSFSCDLEEENIPDTINYSSIFCMLKEGEILTAALGTCQALLFRFETEKYTFIKQIIEKPINCTKEIVFPGDILLISSIDIIQYLSQDFLQSVVRKITKKYGDIKFSLQEISYTILQQIKQRHVGDFTLITTLISETI